MIVSQPCYYCGKESVDGHFNGLDRLDSSVRVYTTTSCARMLNTRGVRE